MNTSQLASGRARHSRYRYLAAAAAAVTAVAHVPLIGDHLAEAPYVGVLFLLLCLVCLTEAVLLLRRDIRLAWLLTGLTAGT